MGIFSNAKDRVVEQTALGYLNSSILEPYGEATSLRLNSTEKTIAIEAELKGEATPIKIELENYDLTQDGDEYFVSVETIRTSRQWLTTLAKKQLCNRKFKLPAKAGKLLMQAL